MKNKKVKELIDNIKINYNNLALQNNKDIVRGHIPSISFIVENEVALFLKKLLGSDYVYYVDCTVKNGKRRPDLVIVNKKTNECVLLVEIKTNMGYCRKLDNIKIFTDELKLFKGRDNITLLGYKYEDDYKRISYPITIKQSNPKMIFLSLTSDNSSLNNHLYNKEKLLKENINYFTLFKGWYNNLEENEINDLVSWLYDNIR